jgi:hypothetical protein
MATYMRCSCGVIHMQKEWRIAWRHALADGRVVSLRDDSGSQIELRSYPNRESLWNAAKTFSQQGMQLVVVEPTAKAGAVIYSR